MVIGDKIPLFVVNPELNANLIYILSRFTYFLLLGFNTR